MVISSFDRCIFTCLVNASHAAVARSVLLPPLASSAEVHGLYVVGHARGALASRRGDGSHGTTEVHYVDEPAGGVVRRAEAFLHEQLVQLLAGVLDGENPQRVRLPREVLHRRVLEPLQAVTQRDGYTGEGGHRVAGSAS